MYMYNYNHNVLYPSIPNIPSIIYSINLLGKCPMPRAIFIYKKCLNNIQLMVHQNVIRE